MTGSPTELSSKNRLGSARLRVWAVVGLLLAVGRGLGGVLRTKQRC